MTHFGLDPVWVAIVIGVNLQTSFLTPPFGFSLFFLRGVAPPEIRRRTIYRGAVPFVVLQLVGLALDGRFPQPSALFSHRPDGSPDDATPRSFNQSAPGDVSLVGGFEISRQSSAWDSTC